MTLLAALAVVALPAPAPPPPPYWAQVDGCHHGHGRAVTHQALERLLRNHRPMTPHRIELAAHLRNCTRTRLAHRDANRQARRIRRWRASYAHVWRIRFNRLAPRQRAWAWSTGACESGNDPTKATGNGYYGAHQWLPSTWYAADRTGMWVTDASWWHQAVVAVRWMLGHGDEQWPNCGD